jgi:hypothetical protein
MHGSFLRRSFRDPFRMHQKAKIYSSRGWDLKFQKVAVKRGAVRTSVPMTGEVLTKVLRGVYKTDPKKALFEATKELVENQGFAAFKTKQGEKELLEVLKGKKKFVGETNHPDGIETAPDPKADDSDDDK